MGSPTKSIILATAPKLTAFLSLCGSSGIIFKVLRSPIRRKKTMHRIMLGMSISDILASIWYFAGTWVIPAGTLSWYGNGTTETVFWAAGDQDGVACSFGGFFNQLAVCTPLYNASLALYYYLAVYSGWDAHRIERIEWYFHVIPWGYALFTSIFAAAADLYGPVEWTCWILPEEVFDENKELSPIQSKFETIQWLFLFGVVWICVMFVSVIFVALYRKMRELEKRMKKYHVTNTNFKRKGNDCEANDCHNQGLNEKEHGIQDNPEPDIEQGDGPSRDIAVPREKRESNISAAYAEEEEGERFDGTSNFADNYTSESSRRASLGAMIGKIIFLSGRRKSSTQNNGFIFVSWLSGLSTTAESPKDEIPNDEEDCSNLSNENEETNLEESRVCKDQSEAVPDNEIPKKKSSLLSVFSWRLSSGWFRDYSKSQKIAIQGMLYVAAFYVTWIFPTITRITGLTAGKSYFAIQFFDTFLVPLQGFLNFCIYIRPRLKIHRHTNPDIGFWRSLREVLLETSN